MPNVSRSRRSWRTSLVAMAKMRDMRCQLKPDPPEGSVVGFEARGGDEHVLETRSHALDLALYPMLIEQRPDAAFRVRTLRIEQRVQTIAELRDALHVVLAVERVARSAHIVGFDLDDRCVDRIHELARRALRHEAAAIEDGEAVTALRFVHVVRRHQDRRAAVDQLEQAFPEIATTLRVDGAGRLVEQQQLGLMQRGGREREPLLLSAAHGSRALIAPVLQVVLRESFLDARGSHRAVEPEDAADEVQVLQDCQVLPQREALGHVADLHAQLLGFARHRVAEHDTLALARPQQPAQHADRGRLARAVRPEKAVDRRARNVETDVIDGRELAEAPREIAGADGRAAFRARAHRLASASRTCTGMPVGTSAAALSSRSISAR